MIPGTEDRYFDRGLGGTTIRCDKRHPAFELVLALVRELKRNKCQVDRAEVWNTHLKLITHIPESGCRSHCFVQMDRLEMYSTKQLAPAVQGKIEDRHEKIRECLPWLHGETA